MASTFVREFRVLTSERLIRPVVTLSPFCGDRGNPPIGHDQRYLG